MTSRTLHAVLGVAFTMGVSLPAAAQAPPAVSPLALVGTWTATAPSRDGTLMTTRVTLTQNQRFNGGASVDGKPVWIFSGRWELRPDRSAHLLTWTYEYSNPELPAASKIDRDDVIAVDGDRMVLRSRLSGKDNVFTRVK